MNELAGPELAGLDRFAGRKKAVELLRAAGALVAEKPYQNNVGYSERADVPIEPRLTWQWWLRYPRVQEAKDAVRDGEIEFFPARWSKVYLHWLDNIQDWCISRQLWWGHRDVYKRQVLQVAEVPQPLQDASRFVGKAGQARQVRRPEGAGHVAVEGDDAQHLAFGG